MARNVKLLLTDNVESLGIVGDVVNVRTGYARNFLLPRNLATQPSEEKVAALAGKRAEAERMLAELRTQREQTSGKLQGVEVALVRSCNDQGHLYASITQQDIAAALNEMGHAVKPRDVRINQVMKRIDNYDVHIKLDSDLDAIIKVHVNADRKLDLERHEEPAHPPAKEADAQAKGAEPAAEEKAAEGRPEKKARADKGDKGEKGAKSEKGPKPEKAPKSEERPVIEKGSFSKVSSRPDMGGGGKPERHAKPEKGDKAEKGSKGKGKGKG